MFDQLIESEPKGADFHGRKKYFIASSIVMGVLFVTAIVVSIYAADYGIGNGSFELVELLPPIEMADAPPKAPQIRQSQPQAQSTASTPTRTASIRDMTETPREVPTISTTPSTQMARPLDGRYTISKFDSNPSGEGTPSRETGVGTGGTAPSGITTPSTVAAVEDVTAPPPVKKVEAPKAPKSGGVLNGSAVSLPKPVYSAAAQAVRAEGQVTVQVLLDESGRVVSATAVDGHILLRHAAEDAARRARFTPTTLSGMPVKVTGVIIYNFVRS
jgi:TonB family protein